MVAAFLGVTFCCCALVGCTPDPYGPQPVGIAHIAEGQGGSHRLAVDPGMHSLFVLVLDLDDVDNRSVTVIDTGTGRRRESIPFPLGTEPGAMVVDSTRHLPSSATSTR